MSQEQDQTGPDFADVAAEDPSTSVEHEEQVLHEVDEVDDGAEAQGDRLPDQPLDEREDPEPPGAGGLSIGGTTPPM